MLTWSLACAPSPARLASTSLAFMFEEVPEPVWKTSMGNWSSWRPSATASPASAIRAARSESSDPSPPFAVAAAAFSLPSQRTTGTGTPSPETLKLSTALAVSPPQSCSVKFLASIEVVVAAAYWSAARARPGGPAAGVCALPLKDAQGAERGGPGGPGGGVRLLGGGGPLLRPDDLRGSRRR